MHLHDVTRVHGDVDVLPRIQTTEADILRITQHAGGEGRGEDSEHILCLTAAVNTRAWHLEVEKIYSQLANPSSWPHIEVARHVLHVRFWVAGVDKVGHWTGGCGGT